MFVCTVYVESFFIRSPYLFFSLIDTEAAHRQKLDDALRYLQLLPSDAGRICRILTPSAAAQARQKRAGDRGVSPLVLRYPGISD